MSLLRNLTGITTPASTDLFYVVQNNTDYKMTSEQFLNFAKSAIVVSLTQAQYDALTPAEKSNGSIYLINDATLSASDIAYGQGTVEDSLDELSDFVSLPVTVESGITSGNFRVLRLGKLMIVTIDFSVTQSYPNSWKNLFTFVPPIAVSGNNFTVITTNDGVSTYAQAYYSSPNMIVRADNLVANKTYRGQMIIALI